MYSLLKIVTCFIGATAATSEEASAPLATITAKAYMDVALRIWNERSYHIASYLLTNLYPIQLANEGLKELTEKLIASPEVAEKPALRRVLVENLAGLERGLKAQLADA